MPGHFTREDVERIARLARLELTEDEKALLTPQLSSFLAYAEQVQQVGHDRRPADVAPAGHRRGCVTMTPRRRSTARWRCRRRPKPHRRRRTLQSTTSARHDHARDSAPSIRDAVAPARTLSRRGLPARRSTRDRRVRPALNAFLHGRARARARAGARSMPARIDGRDLPLLGVPVALKDNICTAGMRDHGGVAHPRALRSAVRRDGRRAPRSGRRGDRRQDQLRRVRDGIVDRELGVRADAQSVGARPHARRLERRIGRRRRGADGAARARLRHRRIDPPAGGALRRRRAQADLRPRLALRPARVRLVARSDWPVRARRSPTRRWRCRSSPAPIRAMRRRAAAPAADYLGGSRPATSPGSAHRRAARARRRRCGVDPEVRSAFDAALEALPARRARSSSTSRSRTARTPSRSTTSSRRRKRARTWRATTASATAFAPDADDARRDVRPHARTRASAPRSSAGSCSAPTC